MSKSVTAHERKYQKQYIVYEQSGSVVRTLVGREEELSHEKSALQNARAAILFHKQHHDTVVKRLDDAEQDLSVANTRADQLRRAFEETQDAVAFANKRDGNDLRAKRIETAKTDLLDTIRQWVPELISAVNPPTQASGSMALSDRQNDVLREIADIHNMPVPETNSWDADEVYVLLEKDMEQFHGLLRVEQDNEELIKQAENLGKEVAMWKKEAQLPKANPATDQALLDAQNEVQELEENLEKVEEERAALAKDLEQEKALSAKAIEERDDSDRKLTNMQNRQKLQQRMQGLNVNQQAAIEESVRSELLAALKTEKDSQYSSLLAHNQQLKSDLRQKQKQVESLLKVSGDYYTKFKEEGAQALTKDLRWQTERAKARLEEREREAQLALEEIQAANAVAQGNVESAEKNSDDLIEALEKLGERCEKLNSAKQSLEAEVDQYKETDKRLRESIKDLLQRVLSEVNSPGTHQFRDDDVELLGTCIDMTELYPCLDAPGSFDPTDNNKHAGMGALCVDVEEADSRPISDFAQLLLSAMFTYGNSTMSAKESRRQIAWADKAVMAHVLAGERELPLQIIRSAALTTYLHQQLKMPNVDGLGYAWAAGMQVQMMCLYRQSVRTSSILLNKDISSCSILEAIGLVRLKLAHRYFLKKRGEQEYRLPKPKDHVKIEEEDLDDGAVGEPPELVYEENLHNTDLNRTEFTHEFFADEDVGTTPEYFVFSMPLFIKELCGGQNKKSSKVYIAIKDNYVGVSEDGKLYSWLREASSDTWTFTMKLPSVGAYDPSTRTGIISWELQDRVHTERYDFAFGDAGHFRVTLLRHLAADLIKAKMGAT
ncbi:hypothetical protein Slin15195_G038070 [Septoria linicola]|uniref:Uncharacterized protein n=1 Tax=Septoria linicola TaxID=215465 RepID=A0A9Q9AQR9_9PEZI|nr:hypothetical protein Slin14017_G119470 [Septoria linicola]USW50488.1 hypothetical protein Slin15195_G038070 [Septoria linicola]